MSVDLKWSNFNSERMELPIRQRWFCSVGRPCIAEASQPSHTVEKLLFWKFGVSAFCLCKVILETSSVTKQLQFLCCQQTIYHRFVDILPTRTWFDGLYPKESRSACSVLGQNIFAHRNTLGYWNRINWHFGFWKKKYQMRVHHSAEQNGFNVKMAFFHLSVWLIGQGGWKICSRPWFDSWHFAVQADKFRLAGNCKFCNFQVFIFKKN